LGFWHYPGVDQRYGPALMYPLVLVLWAGFALIGWRVMRRFGWRGEVMFLVVVTVFGTLRDFAVARLRPDIFAITPGVALVPIDMILWGGLTAFAQGVMRLVAGPATADPLARRGGSRPASG